MYFPLIYGVGYAGNLINCLCNDKWIIIFYFSMYLSQRQNQDQLYIAQNAGADI